jgi:hypothetical protein
MVSSIKKILTNVKVERIWQSQIFMRILKDSIYELHLWHSHIFYESEKNTEFSRNKTS